MTHSICTANHHQQR